MGKTVAVVQSNYIPWKGYFDLIHFADEFILFDDMQYTRRDWRNRNKIKTPNGSTWLTIPVQVKGKYTQLIRETVVSDPAWNKAHWNTIQQFYGKARCFREHRAWLEELYLGCEEEYLSRINFRFLKGICEALGISTKLSWSMDFVLLEERTERLVSMCKQAGATTYLSGPSARAYMDEEAFHAANIEVQYMSYTGYPEYAQVYPPFEHEVSIIDLLLNTGPDATRHMLSF